MIGLRGEEHSSTIIEKSISTSSASGATNKHWHNSNVHAMEFKENLESKCDLFQHDIFNKLGIESG